MRYESFLKAKRLVDIATGLQDIPALNSKLFPFQRDIVSWALRRGRAAIFADCGLGKTPMQLEWAKHIPGNVLIVAPLAVAQQTVREGKKFDVTVRYCRQQSDACNGVTITNYEMIEKFDPAFFTGIVLDESSILKSYSGKIRNMIIGMFEVVPFKLACTATPAPNDYMELGNHSEFLNIMNRTEMLSMFFVHDGGDTSQWRLKGHAQDTYWQWLCSWAVMLRKPSDLGYDDTNFTLPVMTVHPHVIPYGKPLPGNLFALEAATLQERQAARRESLGVRVQKCADIINGDMDKWIVWCNLNSESNMLYKSIEGAVEVKGSDTLEHKEHALLGFANGDIRCLVTKPTIAGFGLNFQICHKMAFVGLSDSYEQYYQAVRRCWRFGQEYPVDVHIITADIEGAVVKNIQRKECDASKMAESMIKHMQVLNIEALHEAKRDTAEYKAQLKMEVPVWL